MSEKYINIVPKVWGTEKWVINDNNHNYCHKKLEVIKGGVLSLHYHINKLETFTLESGKVQLTLGDEVIDMLPGDSKTVIPGTPHSFAGYEFSVITEVSTFHDDDDSYREWESHLKPLLYACFPAKTKIVVEGNNHSSIKNIEDIKEGDKVLTYNELTAEKEYKRVTRIMNMKAERFITISFSNENKLCCTPEHPIAVINSGKVLWREARNIRSGDKCIQYLYPHLSNRLYFLSKNNPGKNKSESTKELISEIVKTKWKDSEYREKTTNSHIGKPSSRKGKTYEEIYGEYSEELKFILSYTHLGQESTKKGMSLIEYYGKEKADEMILKMSKYSKKLHEEGFYYEALKITHQKNKERWENDIEFASWMLQKFREGQQGIRPMSSKELLLDEILQDNFNGEFEYNGNGRLGFSIFNHWPDFININGKKKIIELNGCYWHGCRKCNLSEDVRGIPVEEIRERDLIHISQANCLGYEVLTIWEHELENINEVKDKIENYNYNPNIELVEVISSIEEDTQEEVVYNLEVEGNNNYFAYGILVHNCDVDGTLEGSDTDPGEIKTEHIGDKEFVIVSSRSRARSKEVCDRMGIKPLKVYCCRIQGRAEELNRVDRDFPLRRTTYVGDQLSDKDEALLAGWDFLFPHEFIEVCEGQVVSFERGG